MFVVVYNFGCVCMYVYMSVCQTITLESLDVGSSYTHMWYISMEYRVRVEFVYEGQRVKVKITAADHANMTKNYRTKQLIYLIIIV